MARMFISWSGERSFKVAKLLHEWLEIPVKSCETWLSSEDIDRGARWSQEISRNLEDASLGIICLTRENMSRPWINFEAGALSKKIETARVCTFLIDLSHDEISGPMAQFNHTLPTRDDMWKLIKTLNEYDDPSGIGNEKVKRAFESCWHTFEERFKDIIGDTDQLSHNSMLHPECMRSLEDDINKYIQTSVFFENHTRDDKIKIFLNDDRYTLTTCNLYDFSNLNHENYVYKISRYCERNSQSDDDLIRSKFQNFSITIDGKSMNDFINQYTKKYPDTGKVYFSEYEDDNIYSLFKVNQVVDSKSFIGGTEITMSIPFDPERERVSVEMEYTTSATLSQIKDFTFRTELPCRRLKHSVSISPSDEWMLSLIPMELFYTMKGGKRRSAVVNRIDKSSGNIDMDYWTLPGTGYVRTIYKK